MDFERLNGDVKEMRRRLFDICVLIHQSLPSFV